jgi:hypothetical protein
MKRCPECDFIYDDNDRLCAMDGTGLIHHTGPLPFEEDLLPAITASSPRGRGLTLVAAGIILAVAGFLTFYKVSTRNVFQHNSPGAAKATNTTQPAAQNPVVNMPVETATPSVNESPAFNPPTPNNGVPPKTIRSRQPDEKDPFRVNPLETSTPLPKPVPSATPSRVKTDFPSDKSVYVPVRPSLPPPQPRSSPTAQKEAKPAESNQKNESKVRSFFKKAGRVFKKPFDH